MSSLELVVHCWSGDKVPIYGKLAQLQFSSLLLNPPTIDTTVTICYSPEDKDTATVVNWFRKELRPIQTLNLKRIPLEKRNLFRRAIGRNIAAKESKADVIWFSDIDYLFCQQSTLQLAHKFCMESKYQMVYPKIVNINITHGFGDAYVERLNKYPPHALKVSSDHFQPRKERKAIGGIQILKGDYCREYGYLDGTKWVEPVDPSKGFKRCRGDVPFRKQVGKSEAVDIPGVYRVRHSFCGRDGGMKDHGQKTKHLC